MDRSAQNIDRSSECEIMNLRRVKFVFDVSPLEIIDDKELFKDLEDEDFIYGGGGAVAAAAIGMDINQINLVIHVVNHDTIYQYWSLKSDQQLNSSSLSCQDRHHRDHHHLRDDDDDEEMIMITCRPSGPPKTKDKIILLDRGGVFASSAAAADDNYIMSQLRDVDLLYETEWISKQEVKRCIIQRISESKPAVLLAKPKTVRIRLDLSTILKNYYANPAAAASAYAKEELYDATVVAEDCEMQYDYDYDDDVMIPSWTGLETKILEEEDLISSSSSSCLVCLNEFRVGLDVIKKMPCSHMFHWTCLMNWLRERSTCPLCHYGLPTTYSSRFLSG